MKTTNKKTMEQLEFDIKRLWAATFPPKFKVGDRVKIRKYYNPAAPVKKGFYTIIKIEILPLNPDYKAPYYRLYHVVDKDGHEYKYSEYWLRSRRWEIRPQQ